jgi:hypothetical protein
MPPQTNVYDAAPEAKRGKGLLGFLKSPDGSSSRWIEQSTVRALGHTRRAARRPVWE